MTQSHIIKMWNKRRKGDDNKMLIHDKLTDILYSTIETFLEKSDRVPIAFSGGVDSSLLAKICKDLKKRVFLVTVGLPNSHDILFSKIISQLLSLSNDHIAYEMDEDEIISNYRYIKNKLSCNILSHIENCIAFFQIAQIIKENDVNDFFFTANGFDELFCGYDRYRYHFLNGGEASVIRYMDEKLKNEFQLMDDVSKVLSDSGIQAIQPFLSKDFITFAKAIPIKYKIIDSDDMLRKHILRDVALRMGVPEKSAMHPKKALQYGSLFHKYIIKNKSIFKV